MNNLLPRIVRTIGLCLVVLTVQTLSAATRTVTNVNDSGPGSLRQAILDAQQGDRIEFAIGSGHQTIQPVTVLPNTGRCIVIDGRTQPGYAGKPLIEIDGSLLGGNWSTTWGLNLCGEVNALIVNNVDGSGIQTSYPGPLTVRGCYLGTNADGTAARGNGVGVYSTGNVVVGGPNPGDGNLISGNSWGVRLGSTMLASIQGNVFGSDAAQTKILGAGYHVVVEYNTVGSVVIGGEAANRFYGADVAVESFYSDNMQILSNTFGLTPSGKILGNRIGISLYQATGCLVRGNTIVGGTKAVSISGNSLRNVVSLNSIRNTGMAIDLEDYPYSGPTPNDPGDGDVGPNNYINFPVVTKATSLNGTTTVEGMLSAAPNRLYTIELFRSAACNGIGYGLGETTFDVFDVTTNGSGVAEFTRTKSVTIPPGDVIAGTATTALEGTSEYSYCTSVEGSGTFSFVPSNSTFGAEGTSFTVFVQRTLGTAGTATVQWTATNDTATAGADYTPAGGTLTFGDGVSQQSFSINLPDDNVYEGNETFNLTLSNPTGGASLGPFTFRTATVHDNDNPPSVTAPNVEVDEGSSGPWQLTVPLTMNGAAAIPIVVSFTSFADGSDFTPTSGAVTFNPGETQKNITLTIKGDTEYEQDEFFFFDLNSTHAATGWFQLGLRNDDPLPKVSVESAKVVETDGNTTAQITFTATAPISGTVFYTVFDGSAKRGSDYAHTGFNLVFNKQKSRTISITILGDDEREPDESVFIRIDHAPFDVGQRTATLAILNDDTGAGPRDQTVAVGETASFVVDIGEPRAEPFVINVTSSNPEALSVPKTVTLPAGETAVHFSGRALRPGEFVNVGVKMPAALGGDSFTLRVFTYAKTDVIFEPARLPLFEGQTATVHARLEPAAAETVILELSSSANLETPKRLVIAPGATASFDVKALDLGPAVVRALLPRDYGDREFALFGEVTKTPATPTILRILPPDGPSAGGTEVELEGVAFMRECAVTFGGASATAVRFLGPTLMTAVTPPHAKGVVDVVLHCGALTSTFPSGFNYIDSAPQISHIAPSTGAAAGGTHVRIAGAALRSSCWPFFDGVASPLASLESAASMLAVTPAHAAGNVDVMLRCVGGDAIAEEAFLYVGEEPAASITTVAPLAASPGEEVTITGTRFRPSDRIAFGDAAATITRTAPDKHVVVVPELPAGRISVHLIDVNGRTTTTGPIFAVLEATRPRITSVVPATAPAGAEVELIGEGFRGGYSFEIGGAAATIISSSYERAVVRLGSAIAPGKHEVNVLNAAGQLASIGPAITVTGDGLLLTQVSERCSSTTGGTEVTLIGSGFEGVMLVRFGNELATSVTLVDANTLIVTVPESEAGPVQIRVTRTDGATATLTNAFRYASPFDPNGCSAGTLRGGRAVRH